jgi:hypothetical protein
MCHLHGKSSKPSASMPLIPYFSQNMYRPLDGKECILSSVSGRRWQAIRASPRHRLLLVLLLFYFYDNTVRSCCCLCSINNCLHCRAHPKKMKSKTYVFPNGTSLIITSKKKHVVELFFHACCRRSLWAFYVPRDHPRHAGQRY